MQVTKFLEKIKQYPDLPLLFEYDSGEIVKGGYHVTEIKNAGYETIDCGNSLHSWKEVVVQIWVPEEATSADPWMPTGKFLKIWDVVDSRLALHQDAEIKIEYGDENHLTSNYDIDGLQVTEQGLVVKMAPPRTMCKPREILIPFTNGATVNVGQVGAAVRQRVETVIPLEKMKLAQAGSSCCSPASATESSCCN